MQRGILLAIALLAAHGVAMGADVAAAGNDLAVVESRYTSEGGFIPAVNERRDAAAVFAIAGAIRVNAMADHCSALGPLEAVKANEARNRWMRHNGAMVRAANGYVHLQRAIVQVKQGEAAGTKYRDTVMADAKTGAVATLRGWFPNEVRDAATCDKVVGEYLAGTRDIDVDATFGTTLGNLAGDMQAFSEAKRQ